MEWRLPPRSISSSRRSVDHRDAHAVEATGHLVAAVTELAAGVQDGQHDLGGRLALELRAAVDGDATPVVADLAAAVGQDGDVDAVAVARHGLVDGVVDDLVDEVVQAAGTRRADVHARALAHGLEALEDGDLVRVVAAGDCVVR